MFQYSQLLSLQFAGLGMTAVFSSELSRQHSDSSVEFLRRVLASVQFWLQYTYFTMHHVKDAFLVFPDGSVSAAFVLAGWSANIVALTWRDRKLVKRLGGKNNKKPSFVSFKMQSEPATRNASFWHRPWIYNVDRLRTKILLGLSWWFQCRSMN